MRVKYMSHILGGCLLSYFNRDSKVPAVETGYTMSIVHTYSGIDALPVNFSLYLCVGRFKSIKDVVISDHTTGLTNNCLHFSLHCTKKNYLTSLTVQ